MDVRAHIHMHTWLNFAFDTDICCHLQDNWVIFIGSTVSELTIFTFSALWGVPYLG